MSDKSLFATFARTKPHDSQISMAVVSLLLKFNWTTIALVYSDEERLLADALLKVQRLISGELWVLKYPGPPNKMQKIVTTWNLISDYAVTYSTFGINHIRFNL